MKYYKIGNKDKNEFYTIFQSSDFEYKNPIEYYSEFYIKSAIIKQKEIIEIDNPPFPRDLLDKIIIDKAKESWEENYKEYVNTKIPDNLIKILSTKKKAEQIKLLRGVSITKKQYLAFIFKAYNDFGFKLSHYKAEYLQKGIDKSDLPIVINTEQDDKIETIGETGLSEGQLRQFVEHRKVIVSKFLDKNEEWHCFFTTYKSLDGKEFHWKNGQPHLHYISSSFGLTREFVLSELKNKKYKLPSLPHIDLIDYGNQPKDD